MWMRWLVSIPLCFGLWSCYAWADESVVNNAPSTVEKVKAVVNALGPGYDALYNVRDGQWEDGWSASLYNLKSHDYLLVSVRAGYGAQDSLIYSSLRADLPGISRQFIPETVRGIATKGYLDVLWNVVGKYGSVGPFVGYSWQDDAMAYGFTLGGQIAF